MVNEMEEEFKQCPFCSEDIKKNSMKCEHCGDEFYNETDEVDEIYNAFVKKSGDEELEENKTHNSFTKKSSTEELEENKTQICFFCAEEIKIDAIVCKHCGAEYEKTIKGIDHWVRQGIPDYHQTTWDKFWDLFWDLIWIGVILLVFFAIFS